MLVEEVDFGARYAVASYPGVAFWLKGWATTPYEHELEFRDEEGEFYYVYALDAIESDSVVVAVMVGDDTEHLVDIDELTIIETYCEGCGQIGCGW